MGIVPERSPPTHSDVVNVTQTMHTRFTLILFLSLLPLCTLYAQNPGATRTTTPDEIVWQLSNSDYRIAFAGVGSYVAFSPDQRTPAMKAALVQALKNENERIRRITLKRDEWSPVYKSHGSAEVALRLVKEVAALRDPASISLFLPWLCCGFGNEMIGFGRQAFEPILKFLETPQTGIEATAVSGGISTLRMMVDYWGLSTFSASERARMKQVAAKYIVDYNPSPAQNYSFFITKAISLAASLQEVALLQMAEALVNNDTEIAKRSFDASTIGRLRETAAKASAGTLEERQYRPFEERERH